MNNVWGISNVWRNIQQNNYVLTSKLQLGWLQHVYVCMCVYVHVCLGIYVFVYIYVYLIYINI